MRQYFSAHNIQLHIFPEKRNFFWQIKMVFLLFLRPKWASNWVKHISHSPLHISAVFSLNSSPQRALCLSVFFSSVSKQQCSANHNLMSIFPYPVLCFSLSLLRPLPVFLPLPRSLEPWGLSSQSPQREQSVFQARARYTLQLTGDRLNVWSCLSKEVLMSTPC